MRPALKFPAARVARLSIARRPTGPVALFCFQDSPAARRVRRLSIGARVETIDPASSRKDAADGGVLVVSPAELQAARKLKGRSRAVEIVLLADRRSFARPLPADVYASIPAGAPATVVSRTISNALALLRIRHEQARTQSDLAEMASELRDLNAIGVRLSAERDTDALLEMILTKAREITSADAGSLYLIEEDERAERRLRFRMSQNDSVEVPFREFTLPVSNQSVAGYVALTGHVCRLTDAYTPPAGSSFKINTAYDRKIGYRTKSMLVVPLKTPTGEIIGVFQLINRKPRALARFASPDEIERRSLPFTARSQDLAESLASQAAVALENSRLYKNIERLFEGFVVASVRAIELRDPTTAGHSFRVADLTVSLAQTLDRCDAGRYRGVHFTPDEIKEIRYASVLHDVGKVGVRDAVLVKSKKLFGQHIDLIRQRTEILKRGLSLRYGRSKLQYLLEEGPERYAEFMEQADAELDALNKELEAQLAAVVAANEPSVMPEQISAALDAIARREYEDDRGVKQSLLTPEESAILSIPKGSLTDGERREIESHVSITYRFLQEIPWTRELRRVPDIAHAHHERLDGRGYPLGLTTDQIPLQSKLMMISDVFDALTAADRPYKKSVPVDRALDILRYEKQAGGLDADLVDLFIDAKIYRVIDPHAS